MSSGGTEESGFADQGWPGIPPLPDAATLDRLAAMVFTPDELASLPAKWTRQAGEAWDGIQPAAGDTYRVQCRERARTLLDCAGELDAALRGAGQ